MDKTQHPIELWDSFRERSRLFSKRCAISTSRGEMTFERLFALAERLAVELSKAGVPEESLVGLALPNSIAFVPAFLALMKLSATAALVSPKYRASELRSIVDGVHPQCFLTTASLADAMEQKISVSHRETIPLPQLGDELKLVFPAAPSVSLRSQAARDGFSPCRAALIKFTSGSTGEPKGIAWTVKNVLAEAHNVALTLEITPADRLLVAVPVFHSYGFDLGVLPMLFSGAALILREMFIPRRILEDISGQGVTIFLGVPSMYRFFMETSLSTPPEWSEVRYLLSCTAPLPPDLIAAFDDKYHLPICQHYGSSETGAATNHLPSQVLARPESVGLPLKNVEIKIWDEKGGELPSGEEGEVIVKSQAVAGGYMMGHPDGESLFKDGTYSTGDLGVVDRDGFLYLRGRKKEIINVGGLKVSPFEVAQVLKSFPAVREAVVIGVQDAGGEEVVQAVVTLSGPASEKEILAFCQARLADYKVPRRIDIRDEIPLGPSGKVNLRSEDFR